MPPDAGALADARRANDLWSELARTYDGIETSLVARAWDDLAALAHRLASLEHALAPLVAARAGAERDGTATPAVAALWRAADAHARTLATRFPAVERAARAARDASAAQLAAVRVARSRARSYRATAPVAPRFASHLA